MKNKIQNFTEFLRENTQMRYDDEVSLRDMMPMRPRSKRLLSDSPAERLGRLLRLGYELGFAIAPDVIEREQGGDVVHTRLYTLVKTVDARGKRVKDESLYNGVNLDRVFSSRDEAEDAINQMEDEPVYVYAPGRQGSGNDSDHEGNYFNDGSQYIVSEVVAYNDASNHPEQSR